MSIMIHGKWLHCILLLNRPTNHETSHFLIAKGLYKMITTRKDELQHGVPMWSRLVHSFGNLEFRLLHEQSCTQTLEYSQASLATDNTHLCVQLIAALSDNNQVRLILEGEQQAFTEQNMMIQLLLQEQPLQVEMQDGYTTILPGSSSLHSPSISLPPTRSTERWSSFLTMQLPQLVSSLVWVQQEALEQQATTLLPQNEPVQCIITRGSNSSVSKIHFKFDDTITRSSIDISRYSSISTILFQCKLHPTLWVTQSMAHPLCIYLLLHMCFMRGFQETHKNYSRLHKSSSISKSNMLKFKPWEIGWKSRVKVKEMFTTIDTNICWANAILSNSLPLLRNGNVNRHNNCLGCMCSCMDIDGDVPYFASFLMLVSQPLPQTCLCLVSWIEKRICPIEWIELTASLRSNKIAATGMVTCFLFLNTCATIKNRNKWKCSTFLGTLLWAMFFCRMWMQICPWTTNGKERTSWPVERTAYSCHSLSGQVMSRMQYLKFSSLQCNLYCRRQRPAPLLRDAGRSEHVKQLEWQANDSNDPSESF